MGYEVDFLAVGDGSKSGDAIALRFGNLYGRRQEQTIVVIDGGYSDSGEELVKHIQNYYQTSHVDIVVSTHPDADHANGLAVVLQKMNVNCLWMHRPWSSHHINGISNYFRDGRITDNSVSRHLRESLGAAYNLEKIANSRNTPIIEPFSGLRDTSGCLTVLSPSRPFYKNILPHYRGTPDPISKSLSEFTERKDSIIYLRESWEYETLDSNEKQTSPENESSTVILLSYEGHNLLFTGDAGIFALEQVADYLELNSFDFSSLNFIQVPHHGSKRNVNSSILNRLLGNIKQKNTKFKTAFISAAKEGFPKHPAKKVTNAFTRRGYHVYVTQGKNILHSYNAPTRSEWTTMEHIKFYTQVEI